VVTEEFFTKVEDLFLACEIPKAFSFDVIHIREAFVSNKRGPASTVKATLANIRPMKARLEERYGQLPIPAAVMHGPDWLI
jgi:hypothetical protein